MLLRVAAVMAPRTHNRRCVTGSSGRRREGRESEPQRPNMSLHLFTSAVLFLLLMFCGSGEAAAAGGSKSSQGGSSGKYYVWRDVKDEEETVSSLCVPSLLKVGSDVFAVAEAQDTKKGEGGFTGIASKLLAWTGEQTKEELDKTKLKTQVLEECSSDDKKGVCSIANQAVSQKVKNVHVSRPTTVVKGNDIYMLAGNYSWTLTAVGQAVDWGLMLVKGNVSKKEDEKNERIYWNDTYIIPWNYNGNQGSLKRLVGSGGSGVKMEDGTLVFPLEGTKKEDGTEEDGKTVSLIIYSKDTKSWKLSKGMSAGGCGVPSVVEWEKDRKLMMMTACDDGRRRVYESGDKGDSWTEALGTLSRVWGNKKGEKVEIVGSGFITTKIEERDVMLVTLPVYAKKAEKEEKEKGVLHLWLTDNTHIADIGPVSGKEEEDVTASSLLYKSAESKDKKDELIALYEKKGGDDASHSLLSVRLTAQLERVKEVLKTWKKVDERVSQLCPTLLAQEVTSSETACSADVKITDGLVGFLSGNFSENKWRDEYLGVNATVNKNDGATKASDGVTFQGAWAEWPVGSQGENQLYHFANHNFTLVATVSIHEVPTKEGNIPLLGVKMAGAGTSLFLGLSYNKEKKWWFLCGGGQNKEHSRDWDPETKKKDHVVILLRNGSHFSAYVDGERVGDVPCALETTDSKVISHFYIGGSTDGAGGQEDVSVTVTNVLLYNRPLDEAEIGALNPNKAPTLPQEEKPSEHSTVSSDSVVPPSPPVTPNDQQTETPSTAGTHPTEQEQSMGSSKGAGSGGASKSAMSTVSTSSAEEDSVVQVTSGTSPDGTQTMDAASSHDGNTAVETEARNTVQGDGSPQIPVGISDTADANTPTTEGEGQDGPTVNPEAGASSGENGEPTEEANGQEEEVQPHDGEVNTTALSSSLGNVSQGHNSDAGSMRESGLLPSLFVLLGLWGFAAL
ncbi:putative trans-sialidase, Group VI [Trypanosoma cruzi]|uniref:Trans-sialidase, putative n=2 Tax=Trypanosoma cruzi TaxID=5693 RepID=Q4E485_TRYCC|nr:trans-sialidase, putative [Trypanosoma cruzi]EAN99587.1 trans-sialidase, putative [Trypanosoma cruzi]PWV17080.1 putative trans-sialidase, Group VI [Trypanosoma cruzi]|eukprot:XP_821438.1 trans-sialidase [Trypanosoma cruzi strain CL Brener]